MSRARFLGLALLLVTLHLAPSRADDDDVDVPKTATPVNFDFAQWVTVDGHTFTLEKTTLPGVARELGLGVVESNHRDAGAGEYFIDYKSGNERIRFSCSAEMGGDSHELESVEVRPLAESEKRAAYPVLRGPVVFQFGSAGIPYAQVVRRLGSAPETGGVRWYVATGRPRIEEVSRPGRKLSFFASLRLRVTAGKVTAIALRHVTESE